MSTIPSSPGPETWDRKMTVGRFFAAALLPVILITGAVWFYTTHPLPRFSLTFVTVDSERVFSTISPYGRGMEQEMAKAFCSKYDLKLKWIRTKTAEEAWNKIITGEAQVMIGQGWRPSRIPEGMSIAPGPVYETIAPVLLSHSRRPLDLMRPNVCERVVLVPPQPALVSAFKAYAWTKDCRPEYSVKENFHIQDLLAEENEFSNLPYWVADGAEYKLHQPFFHRVRPATRLNESIGYRWYWRSDEHMLDERMKAYFDNIMLSGELADLKEQYSGFFPKKEDYGRVWLLKESIRKKMPLYKNTILAAAKKFQLDPLLLVAVIYQESAFNQEAVSHTGVRGLMQLTQETASRLGATDRTDPVQSIWYGAKYLRRIWEKMEPLGLEHWDRWNMTIGSYNQGIGHIFDAMLLAKRLGHDPRKWRNVKGALLKLTQEKYHADSVFGYTRGHEGVDYVDRIRFYYYVLKGWTSLPGLELNELSAFRLSLTDLGLPH